jgi:sulfide:quinone oxidoreductase
MRRPGAGRVHRLERMSSEIDPTTSPPEPFRVVIAGGGVAAVETALALRALASERISLTLLAPDPELVYRPMTVREPFAYGSARRYPLDEIAADVGAELIKERFGWVDAAARIAHTSSERELPYDALMLAVGAHAKPHWEHALTIDDRRMDELLHGLIQDIEDQYVHSLAFVIPAQMAWPLPIYELALMTAARAYDVSAELSVTIVTPEDGPLAIFGRGASDGVSQMLSSAGIKTITSAYAEVPQAGHLLVNPGERQIEADRIIALPELFGPAIRGLPSGSHGFIPTDPHGCVHGVERIFAAGDAVDFAVKQGGLAAQQADAAAQSIAALAGVAIEPQPFDPVVRGMLLTGNAPKYLQAHITGGHGFSSEISDTPSWSPPAKIAAKYLAPYLDERDHAAERQSAVG